MRATTAAALRLLGSDTYYDQTSVAPLRDGEAGTGDTLMQMRTLVGLAKRSQLVQRVASAIVAASEPKNRVEWLIGVDGFMRECVVFKPDALGAEVLRSPDQLLNEIRLNGRAACDCDDASMLGASLIAAMGMMPYFVLCRLVPGGPFVHVHFAAQLPDGSVFPLDPQQSITPGNWTCREELREVVEAVA